MEKTFSDSELHDYGLNTIKYSQLKDFTPHQLLKAMPLAILYQVEEDYGHWTLLHRTVEGIEFFDPYSYMPDAEFKELEYKQPHYLAHLLKQFQDEGVTINYNQYKFQRQGRGINTCGRWCIIKSLFDNMPIDLFARMINRACEKLSCTPDELSVIAFQR